MPSTPLIALLTASLAAQQPPPGASSPRDVAALLPAETVLAVDGTDLASLLADARELVRAVGERMPPPYRGLVRLAEPFVAQQLGLDLDELADDAVPGPWAIAVVADDAGPVPIAVVHTRGRPVGLEARGLAARAEDGVLVVAARNEHCARYHEWRRAGAATLAARPEYLAARAPRPGSGTVRLFVDVARLRGDSQPRALDPFGRLLLGPIAAALETAGRFDGTLALGAGGLHLTGRFDGGLDQRAERWLLANAGQPRALPSPPPAAFATLSLDRSLRDFWADLDALVGASEAVQARAFLSIADALLGGSLVDELVPALGETWTLFVLAVRDEDAPDTVVALPSFALVADRRGEAAGELLQRLFRNLVSIQRIEGARKGEVTFVHRRGEGPGGARLELAEPDAWRGPAPPPTAAAFLPTLALGSAHVVLASTRAGAEEVLAALAQGRAGGTVRGDVLRIAPARLADYVRRNRALLVLDKILDSGMPRQAAQREIDGFAALLDALSAAALDWRPVDGGTEVELKIEVRDG